MGTAKNLNRTW